ncbi:MAG: PUR family DNA/RNA-binding protein [Flavobacteriaceae bacterium]|jgi:hypothetical protein|nr:PUR family DNA/RNA-binding protein [Flavobacteriaceae bacterium]
MERDEKNKSKGQDVDYIFSKTITAGKRIYYLDVKQNRKGELFLVITESKKIIDDNEDETQSVHFEKHKIFLYKEEFDKFADALSETMQYIKENNTVDFVPHDKPKADENSVSELINLNLDF